MRTDLIIIFCLFHYIFFNGFYILLRNNIFLPFAYFSLFFQIQAVVHLPSMLIPLYFFFLSLYSLFLLFSSLSATYTAQGRQLCLCTWVSHIVQLLLIKTSSLKTTKKKRKKNGPSNPLFWFLFSC